MHYTANGVQPIRDTPVSGGKCLVPSSHIEVGPIVTGQQDVVSDLVLANPNFRYGSAHGASPLRRFLESLYLSLGDTSNQTAMTALGVPERVSGLVADPLKRQTLVKEFLDGKTVMSNIQASTFQFLTFVSQI